MKIEERKLREEEFLMQVWIIINPNNYEFIDSGLFLEFLKIIYDPYSGGYKNKQEDLLKNFMQ